MTDLDRFKEIVEYLATESCFTDGYDALFQEEKILYEILQSNTEIVKKIKDVLFRETGQTQFITKWDFEQILKSVSENK